MKDRRNTDNDKGEDANTLNGPDLGLINMFTGRSSRI